MKLFITYLLISILSICNAQVKWFKGNIHTHTTNSDGKLSPDSLVKVYKSNGYDFLVITDHNFVTDISQYVKPDYLLIKGEEITFSRHVNGIGLSEVVRPSGLNLADVIHAVKDQQAISILNHPIWPPTRCYFKEIYAMTDLNFMEIHNALTESWGYHDDRTLWDSLLTANKKIYGVASDDAHAFVDIAHGWIQVRTDSLTKDSILSAIKNGNFYSSTGIVLSDIRYDGKVISIESTNGDEIKFIGKNGQILKTAEGKSADYNIDGSELYVRTEITNKNGQKAWTQPVFISNKIPAGESGQKAPTSYYIEQNFPNPFNSSTKIDYFLPVESNVQVEVYNVMGERVETLINRHEQAGKHEIFINSESLNSGFYLYQMHASSIDNKVYYNVIKKMMCIK